MGRQNILIAGGIFLIFLYIVYLPRNGGTSMHIMQRDERHKVITVEDVIAIYFYTTSQCHFTNLIRIQIIHMHERNYSASVPYFTHP